MDFGKLFTGIAVPNLLLGQITMVFQELVYYLGVEGEDFFRIMLCFDNNKSDMLETSDIDYSEIRKLVIEEMTEEQRLLDQEFDKAQYELEEAEKAEREAYYENNIKPLYDRQNEEVDENNNEEQKESLFKRRFSDDE